ncbi:MAG: hypothetical protein KIS94_07385 [Chitinophagales bacterium]|nr:hypothetical protein [Chitinophagales bacterium]
MNHIRWLAILLLVMALPAKQAFAFEPKKLRKDTTQQISYPKQGGNFSLGVRNVISAFNHGDPSEIGTGIGGHFRVQVVDRVNTEWYADVIPANIKNKAHRMDYHIGWSVMYYVIDPKGFNRKLTPYIVAGHCFDWTTIKLNGTETPQSKTRFSSAVQAGMGCHYNVTPRFDITLTTQYMFHLGKELHAHEDVNGKMFIEEHKHAGWEGHLLISIGVNYKISQIWKPRG